MVKKYLLLFFIFCFITSCSQNVDLVNITRRPGVSNFNLVSDVEHQGGQAQSAISASANLSDQNLGGNLVRTKSSSPSFQMTSGIGVE